MSFSIQSFRCTYNTITYIHGAFPLAFPTPCWFSFAPSCVPFVFPSTYLAPSSCDRNRPPPSQVACKLTPLAPPFTQLTHPSQIPRTPAAPRLTMTTSGIFRLLLFGTVGTTLQYVNTHFYKMANAYDCCTYLNTVFLKHLVNTSFMASLQT